MQRTRFHSRALPAELGASLWRRLRDAHEQQPLSAVDPRETVRRVADLAAGLGLRATVYRGGLDLRGVEVDHVWLEVQGRVVDAAFPVFHGGFVDVLRRFVAGEAESDELAVAAAIAELDRRVVGEFPERLGYIGAPLWGSDRWSAEAPTA